MFYKRVAKLISDKIFSDPETPHNLALTLGQIVPKIPFTKWALKLLYQHKDPDNRLGVMFCGKWFENPVGLAAGFDKNGVLTDILDSLGFGFTVRGSITAKKCKGNPRPRIFRLPEDKGLINRMGLNNQGADRIYAEVKDQICNISIGTSITSTPGTVGQAAINDFVYTYKKFHPISDFMTLNLSCPNTAEGKTFEDPEALDQLLGEIMAIESFSPILIKISPDLSYNELAAILDVSQSHKIDGYVATNTSSKRNSLMTSKARLKKIGPGGFSGPNLKFDAVDKIAYIHNQIQKAQIIGVGGMLTGDDAASMINAGATLVKGYNGFIQKGLAWPGEINTGLLESLDYYRHEKLEDMIGYNEDKLIASIKSHSKYKSN